jgi:hypothetical protein
MLAMALGALLVPLAESLSDRSIREIAAPDAAIPLRFRQLLARQTVAPPDPKTLSDKILKIRPFKPDAGIMDPILPSRFQLPEFTLSNEFLRRHQLNHTRERIHLRDRNSQWDFQNVSLFKKPKADNRPENWNDSQKEDEQTGNEKNLAPR